MQLRKEKKICGLSEKSLEYEGLIIVNHGSSV
jgi:hypothetical protein